MHMTLDRQTVGLFVVLFVFRLTNMQTRKRANMQACACVYSTQ